MFFVEKRYAPGLEDFSGITHFFSLVSFSIISPYFGCSMLSLESLWSKHSFWFNPTIIQRWVAGVIYHLFGPRFRFPWMFLVSQILTNMNMFNKINKQYKSFTSMWMKKKVITQKSNINVVTTRSEKGVFCFI